MNALNDGIILLAAAVVLGSILAVIFVTGEKEQLPITRGFYSLGTIIQLKVYGKRGEKAIEEAVQKLIDIDDKMSVFKDYSEISKVNINAGSEAQVVSKDTYYVIKKAIEYCRLSEGAFDITIGPIAGLWGIGTKNERLPSDNEVEEKLKLVNYKDIILDEVNSSVKLKHEGQQIDVGGIAKGYAADEVKNILAKNHIKSAIINLGGNIFALGKKKDGTPWTVGIQDPLKSRGEFVGTISTVNKSIVTSGNYERYFLKDGKRFHHIIDPRTGYPSESDIISTTIISDLSVDGDGLSTGVYILGLEKALKLVESLEGIDAIFITKDKKIYATEGIKENFKLFNREYIY